jgi:hypothetical protein
MTSTDPLARVEIDCRTWDDLVRRLNGLTGDWVLRGHREASWTLQTTLERHAPSDRTRRESERAWRKEFQRRAHFYLNPQHIPADKIEWLALMQHFGAPTRLLDFTRSPYVATYFAVEDKGADEQCAVLAVDRTWCAQGAGTVLRGIATNADLVETMKQAIGDSSQAIALGVTYAVAHDEKQFASRVLKANPTLVIPLEPDRLSERLSVQQGTFLCSGNVEQTFMENLTAMNGWEGSVRKFTLPFAERGRALEQLRKMNITRASLFPGLDGFAQSFRNALEREPVEQRRIRLAVEGLDFAVKSFTPDADTSSGKGRDRE